MKFIYSFLFLFLSISSSFAQINVGNGRDIGNLWVKDHKSETFEKIKNGKTSFVLPNLSNENELKSIIESVWNVNEITFINQNEFDANKEKYSSTDDLIIQLLIAEVTVSEGPTRAGGIVKQRYQKAVFLAGFYDDIPENEEIELHRRFNDIAEIYLPQGMFYASSEEQTIPNIKLGIIKNHLQELNRKLQESQSVKMLDGIKNEEKLALLSEKTLIVPWEGVANSPLASKGNNLIESWNKPPNLFKKFKYSHEMINHKDLEEKILGGEHFYYLHYVQYSNMNILSIIDSLSGEIIYLEVKQLSNLVRPSRISDISKAISKSSKSMNVNYSK